MNCPPKPFPISLLTCWNIPRRRVHVQAYIVAHAYKLCKVNKSYEMLEESHTLPISAVSPGIVGALSYH